MTLNTKKLIIIFVLFIMLTPFVSGLTETGEFRTSSYSQYLAGDLSSGDAFSLDTSQRPLSVYTNEISAINGLDYISIEFTGVKPYVDNGNLSASARFTSEYGDGTIGYVNLYNYLGVWIGGYLYVYFDTPLVVTTTGAKNILLTYTISEMDGFRFLTNGAIRVDSSAITNVKFGSQYMACISDYTIGANPSTSLTAVQKLYNNINRQFKNDYTLELNEVSNIVTGSITKNIDGTIYPSKTLVLDTTNTIVASEPALSSSNFNFISSKSPIRLTTLDGYGVWHNTSFLLQPEIIYDYDFTPLETYPNETVQISWSSNEAGTQLTNLKYATIHIQSDYNAGNKFFATDENGYWYNYLKNSSGYWGQYQTDGYVFNLGTSFPNNRNIVFPASGNWTVFSTLEDLQGNQYYETKYYNVLGNLGAYRLTIYPINGNTGDFISGSHVNLLDTQTGVWTNRTVTYNYECAFQVSTGFYKFVVFAPDDTYSDVNQGIVEGIFIVNEDIATTVTLYPLTPEGAIPGDIFNSTVFIGVKEPEELKPVYGATVRVGNQIEKTNSVGIATFQLLNNTAYKATASASGYAGTSVDFTPNNAVYSFDIALGSSGSVPTGVTPVITTKPVVTVVTPSAWAEGNASVCGAPLKNNASLIEFTKSKLACNGFETAISQSLALAGFIIVILMGVGYAVARKTGSYVGAIVGFVFAWSVALIPFYVFVAIIVLCVLIFAVIIASKIPG